MPLSPILEKLYDLRRDHSSGYEKPYKPALCKNHHWAMDRRLLAPGPDLRWHVSPTLDRYSPALKPLVELSDRPLTQPREKRFIPSEKALQWRLDRLAS